MYKETDNLIGIKFRVRNSKYEILSDYILKNLDPNSNFKSNKNDWRKKEICDRLNDNRWEVINRKIIHELW